ncbi:subtilisin-like protein [Mollisia scopiformis]|uniref:Subtilisin-like protein n=1 Tax=Mollisia scopiformis TaxID=149040 RepID=A0A132B6R6_MOLSC|nr:subtilisin-like protein [Mollisia scopiformis]KUJ08102.1 subtilisin-like protein [Mollisia scopiformis]
MRASILLPLGALFSSVLASNYVVHERRHENTDQRWSKVAQLRGDQVMPIRIGLKQSNLEHSDRWLMEVSDPKSPRYGQHWTAKEIVDAFKPSVETINAVHTWLNDSGIHTDRHQLSEGLGWLQFDASIEEAENLFQTTYHLFEHGRSSTKHVACDEYSLPSHISPHIDFISPGVHFDAKTKSDTDQYFAADGTRLLTKRSVVERKMKRGDPRMSHKPSHHMPKPAWKPSGPYEAQICNTSFVTPACLRLLYGVPSNLPAVEGNSLGIVEYTPESYLPSDLDLFFEVYEPQAVGERPVFDSIDGGFLYDFNLTNVTAFNFLGEPSLDLQYSMALVYPQDVILYQVGDLAEDNLTSFNNFLDAIHGSYCTYDGGDDPEFDAVYPDPYPGPDSYKGKEDCGTYAAAKVISTSYSYSEIELSPAYEERQCREYLKLGLMGTTFVYSSGDYGVEFDGGGCINPNGTENDGNSGIFVASFPGGCPYILSAGATQIRNGTYDVDAAIKAGEEVEVVMELYLTPEGLVGIDVPPGANTSDQVIFSSTGGFSNVFALPEYQASAVKEYMEKYAPDYPGQYNNSGTVRGFPDIASNGAWFSIAVFGELSQVFGTSCAAPTIASLLALINGERIKAGKSTVGFVNPTLYAHPEVLNDITEGQNPGCGTNGFSAVPGWDPTTGLGTPNYPKMLELFLSLS